MPAPINFSIPYVELTLNMNCQVDLAENGFKALELYKTIFYDLILMDEGMPGMSGSQVIEKISSLEAENQRTPIIVLTEFSGLEDKKRCLAAGADDVFIKPVRMNILKEIITRNYILKS